MAQSRLSICNAEKDLECTICLSDFTEPKLLACLHTFCMTCLKRYCEDIDEEEKSCPLCRTEFIVPEGGVEMLKTDQVKARLVLEKQTREGKQKLPKCDICENADAEAYCVECMQGICSACRNGHLKISSTKLHKIVGLDEKPSGEALQKIKSQFCTTHAGKQMELYCCDCEKLLCYFCHVTEHSKHVCKVPSEVTKSKCKEFEKDQNRVKLCIENEIEMVNELKATPMTHLREISKVEKAAEDSLVAMINHLEEQKSKLLTRLKEMKEEKLKTVKSEDYVSEFRCAELNSFLQYSSMVKERGTDYEILAIANELHKRAENLVKSQETRSRKKIPLPNVEMLKQVTSKIEKVKGVILKLDLQHQNLSIKKDLQQTQDWGRLISNNHVESFTSGRGSLHDIVIHNNEVYMTSGSGTPQILVYSLQNLSTVSRRISVSGLTTPTGLAFNKSDSCLYASNGSKPGHIYRINIRGDSVTGWALENDRPCGLSISKQKNLLVSYRSRGQIDEFYGSGQLIRSIKLTNCINGIFHAIELKTGEFIVCQEYPLHRICLADSSGKVIKSYGKVQGSGVGQLNYPMHVELDQKGNILVSNTDNHKLRVLTSDLRYMADVNITDKQFLGPTSTCWDKANDRLLVTTEYNGFYMIAPKNL